MPAKVGIENRSPLFADPVQELRERVDLIVMPGMRKGQILLNEFGQTECILWHAQDTAFKQGCDDCRPCDLISVVRDALDSSNV